MKISLSILLALVLSFGLQAQKYATAVTKKEVLEQVGPIKAKLMLKNGALLIDVREESEVAELAYDVADKMNIPLSQLKERMSEIPKDRKLVLACRSGGRSGRASKMLLQNGYTTLVNLKGGMNAWSAKGLDTIVNGEKKAKKACCAGGANKSCSKDKKTEEN